MFICFQSFGVHTIKIGNMYINIIISLIKNPGLQISADRGFNR